MNKTLIVTSAALLLLGPIFIRPGITQERSLISQLEKETVEIVRRCGPAVVSVTTEPVYPHWWDNLKGEELPAWIEEFLKSDLGSRKRRSTGAGFLISSDGKILTTESVIGRARQITVALEDGRVLPARVLGKSPDFNIALLKVDGKDLPCLSLGNSSAAQGGSWVIALGRPFGLATSASWGIVSGLGRAGLGIAPYEKLMQITAPINPGDSGGPILNSRGEVIGIIAASFSGYREFEFDWDFIRRFHRAFPDSPGISPGSFFQNSQAYGVGFAIPIDLAREVIAHLSKNKGFSRGWIGVYPKALTGKKGVAVTELSPDGPGARAGLRGGDIISSVNGQPVDSPRSLQKMILFLPAGETIDMKIMREGEIMTFPVVVGEKSEGGKGERP
ncbi:MAG: trypsin-like peptidase domain-containing protein [Candidatus Euphemobacter frigidus]|nr:trypsin-like peptidase domain-containing protein [Candidatus Euphemobacter frigidus]MDP8276330.1 trypsin-like peptidase domain-containing protein [Candidatus Euphemobacter frigidus]